MLVLNPIYNFSPQINPYDNVKEIQVNDLVNGLTGQSLKKPQVLLINDEKENRSQRIGSPLSVNVGMVGRMVRSLRCIQMI